MLSVKEKGLLINIIKHSDKINEKVANTTKEEFFKDEDMFQIVCFNILQIGELAKHFDDAFVSKYDRVPWKYIKGMRDKVVHGYDTIDCERVWETAITDINPLKIYCEQILQSC